MKYTLADKKFIYIHLYKLRIQTFINSLEPIVISACNSCHYQMSSSISKDTINFQIRAGRISPFPCARLVAPHKKWSMNEMHYR